MASRLTWIALALALAVYGLVARPLVLGLDLQGGVSMRYELELPETVADAPPEQIDEMMNSTVDTLRNRINTYGIVESTITRQGEREIVIELPGSSKDEADTIQSVISRVGFLEFRIVLRDNEGRDDDTRDKIVVAEETERLRALLELEENQGRTADEVDVSSLSHNLAEVVYRWIPFSDKMIAERRTGSAVDLKDVDLPALLADQPLTVEDYALVKFEKARSGTFTGSDIESAASFDQGRGPEVNVVMYRDRASEFGDWTEPLVGRSMGIVLDGRLAQNPAVIQNRLEGNFSIQSGSIAGFSQAEIKDYLTVIRSGSLQTKPRLMSSGTIGPTLGESSIRAGLTASAVGFVLIILFMVVYYRLNGVVAALCLLLNMTLMGGVLMFLGATLTLPGIAGLVLTLGMAVDANILIFERIREESDRAKSIEQTVKLGFEKALSTIVDANVTTFVTAFILFKVGTGPVRGFAVILMLGILTSMFSVLVFGRVIYEWMVSRGVTTLNMGRLVKRDTAIQFMSKARVALGISCVAVVASLALFFSTDEDKYGLDFLGGYKARVLLTEPATQGEVAAAVGEVFNDVQVISVASEGKDLPSGTSDQFVVKVKESSAVDTSGQDADEVVAQYSETLKGALAGMMLPDFVSDLEVTEDPETLSTAISARLSFDESTGAAATPEAVAGHLGFLTDVQTSKASGGGIDISGTWSRVGLDPQQVVQRLRTGLAAAPDLPPASEPFLESTTISSTVGVELRDSAIRAIILSCIVVVLYIRVRFHEYRYGLAAIIAVAHDVCITLGLVSLMHFTGLVDVEINLAMIAAFLTILGYSLNDTIVLFDRVRENLPRMSGKSLTEVLNISVNQTLARTLLTSLTTLTALVIIFIFNYGKQNILEGFSFAMIVGVLVGTYSSIFIASPVLTLIGPGRATPAPNPKGEGARKNKKRQEVPA